MSTDSDTLAVLSWTVYIKCSEQSVNSLYIT